MATPPSRSPGARCPHRGRRVATQGFFPPLSPDPLDAALPSLRIRGTIQCRSDIRAPRGKTLPVLANGVMLHARVAGPCWLAVDGADPALQQPGHFALVPHGQGHRLMAEPGMGQRKSAGGRHAVGGAAPAWPVEACGHGTPDTG